MKLRFILLCTTLSLTLTAQRVQVISQYELPLPNKRAAYYPVLSPDGGKLLYSKADYNGLFLYNIHSAEEKTISTLQNSGYQPIFSNDGKRIFFRNTTFEQGRRYDALRSYEPGNGKQTQMLTPQRNLQAVRGYANGALVQAGSKLYKATFGRSKAAVPPHAASEELKLVVYQQGKRTEITPIKGENVNYIWVSLSPDQTKILFTAVGKGTFICNLNGELLAEIGYLNAPVWYGNDWIVGMCDKDNGEHVTASEVVMATADGKTRISVSDKKHIAMYPTAAPQTNRIVYNTIDGKLIVSEISIH